MHTVGHFISAAMLLTGIFVTDAQAQSHSHGSSSAPAAPGVQSPANASPAAKAYMEAIDKMHGPMAEGVQASDPDVAFVKGMIPHHQGAIDMAKVLLQYGNDRQTKKWAEDVIREQEREINEMQAWLKTKEK